MARALKFITSKFLRLHLNPLSSTRETLTQTSAATDLFQKFTSRTENCFCVTHII